MKIAVASGKGGTGKTTVAVSLALATKQQVILLDCDVEEPNAGIFLSQKDVRQRPINVLIPVIDSAKCTSCGACAKFCQFNAIVHIGQTVLVFPELCHSCGGCTLVCPQKAIHEEPSPIGTLTESIVNRISIDDGERKSSPQRTPSPLRFAQGLLSIGKAMSPPIIREVKLVGSEYQQETSCLTIIDAPPGTSCPMGSAVSGVDYVILVTEPTPFGLHDLDLAVKTVRKMNIKFGVIINRSDSGDDKVSEYCKREKIQVLMEIAEDRRIAQAYSTGKPLIEAAPEYAKKFAELTSVLQKDTY